MLHSLRKPKLLLLWFALLLCSCAKPYVGGINASGLAEGNGIQQYPNSDWYVGLYKNGKRSGQGIYSWNNTNSMYFGVWKNNLRHGKGTFLFSDGRMFIGEWKDNDPYTGNGTFWLTGQGIDVEPSTGWWSEGVYRASKFSVMKE